MHIKLNADTAGMGDLLAMTWMAEGAKEAGSTVEWWAQTPAYRMMLKMMGQTFATSAADAVLMGHRCPVFNTEITIRGSKSRVHLWADYFGGFTPKKPHIAIPHGVRGWAEREAAARRGDGGKPLVLMFPLANYTARIWPIGHWVDLAWKLDKAGCAVAGLSHRKEFLLHFPWRYWNQGWDHIAALMEQADLIITNDSGPGWLAATLQRPHLAMMGPTSNMFAPINPRSHEVRAGSTKMPCDACWFNEEFGFDNFACGRMCAALASIKPSDVLPKCMEVLSGNSQSASKAGA